MTCIILLSMKFTESLKVYEDPALPVEAIQIHPNDGFDLGLVSYSYKMKVFANCSADEFNKETAAFIEGEVRQENKCRVGTVIMNPSYSSRLGNPETIRMVSTGEKILILRCRENY